MNSGTASYYGGILPASRHAVRVALNRAWSAVLKRSLLQAGESFNVDFTARIYGGGAIAVGSRFHATRGLKLVVANPASMIPLVTIGDDVCVNEYVTINAFDPLEIGDHVLIGSRVYIGNASHGSYRERGECAPSSKPNSRPMVGTGRIAIGANVWIGEGAIIPGGLTIGEGSIVGAGAVVTRPVPAGVIVAGNPARIVREFDPASREWSRRTESVPAS